MSAQHCAPAASGPARELLSFRVGAQEFCVNIMAVREVRDHFIERAELHGW